MAENEEQGTGTGNEAPVQGMSTAKTGTDNRRVRCHVVNCDHHRDGTCAMAVVVITPTGTCRYESYEKSAKLCVDSLDKLRASMGDRRTVAFMQKYAKDVVKNLGGQQGKVIPDANDGSAAVGQVREGREGEAHAT